MTEYRLAVTYGGWLGKLVRKLFRVTWNHIIIVRFEDGVPVTTYESNLRGVHGHKFQADPDLSCKHAWYEAVEPLTELDRARLGSFCEGACGKLYALHYWLLLFYRVVKQLLFGKVAQALLSPAATCVTFVNAACAHVGRPVSVHGKSGLPDDVRDSPHWRKVA